MATALLGLLVIHLGETLRNIPLTIIGLITCWVSPVILFHE